MNIEFEKWLKEVGPEKVKLLLSDDKWKDLRTWLISFTTDDVMRWSCLDRLVPVQDFVQSEGNEYHPTTNFWMMRYESEIDGHITLHTKPYEREVGYLNSQVGYGFDNLCEWKNRDIEGAKDGITQELAWSFDLQIMNIIMHELAEEITNDNATSKRESIVQVDQAIQIMCNEIAHRTRRGAGNWIIMHPRMYATIYHMMDSTGDRSFFFDTGKMYSGIPIETPLRPYIGSRLDNFQIYASDKLVGEKEILVGYTGRKGKEILCDSGIAVSPYDLVIPRGVTVNPVTFETVVGFGYRYALYGDDQSSSYYRKMTLDIDLVHPAQL